LLLLALLTFIYNASLYYKLILKQNYLLEIIFFTFIIFFIFFDIASNLKLEWDGQALWIYKALNFFHNNSFNDLKDTPLNSYPHLGAFIWGFFWQNNFLQHEYLGRLMIPFIYVISIFSTLDLFKTSKIKKILLLIFFLILTYDLYLFEGYQEYLIFSLILIFAKYFYLSQENKGSNNYFIFIFLAIINLIIWSKQEGAFFALILSFLSVLFLNIQISKKLLILVFSLIFVSLNFYLFNLYIGKFIIHETAGHMDFRDIANLSFTSDIVMSRSITIFSHLIVGIIKYPVVLITILLIIFSYFEKNYFQKNFYVIFFMALTFSFIFVVFFFTSNNLSFHLGVALDRLLFQTSSFYLPFLISFLIKNKMH